MDKHKYQIQDMRCGARMCLIRDLWPAVYFLIYDFFFLLGFTIYLPIYIWRKKINISALAEKLGFIRKTEDKEAIWIQVVSVGEVILIGSLIKRLKEVYDYPIVISTTTLTGNKIAKQKYGSKAKVIFFPLDVSFVLKKVLKIVKPKIFIVAETEIWPNLYHCLKKKNIPIVIVNGRISDKAFRQYKLVKYFMKKVINKCDYIGVQNADYRERFLFLGACEEKTIVSGNMKFEGISIDQSNLSKIKEKYIPILKREGNLLVIAASTHFPEEEIIVDVYRDIFKAIGGVTLLIAPRHPERTSSVEKIIASSGFNPVRISEADSCLSGKGNIFIVDTVGELLYFYSIADICFVGGSLSKDGGHNILEPIYFLKPTVFGPNMNNFQDVEEIVLGKGAGLKVKDSDDLREILTGLVKQRHLRDNLRRRCLEVFENEKKSLENNLRLILKAIHNS